MINFPDQVPNNKSGNSQI